LADFIRGEGYDLHLALGKKYERFVGQAPLTLHNLSSIPTDEFRRSLYFGRPVFNKTQLRSYVREDLDLIEKVQPNLIVGDFRLSLSVSARVAGVPYIAIGNSWWSPGCSAKYELGDSFFGDLLGHRLSQSFFSLIRPLAFRAHARPLNAVRREWGMAPLADVRSVYTDADLVLYADSPDLQDGLDLPDHHRFVGPVAWEPVCHKPEWWSELEQSQRPTIYVTLGSTGNTSVLPSVLRALNKLEVNILLARNGHNVPAELQKGLYAADYIPGSAAMKLASVAVFNGGIGTATQALLEGVPSLGLVSNMDQQLCMNAIEGSCAGLRLRTHEASEQRIENAVLHMLEDGEIRAAAKGLSVKLQSMQPAQRFRRAVAQTLGAPGAQ
jgi:UDP:flavonoid glycosyltransferase YjiC (YdhE family)